MIAWFKSLRQRPPRSTSTFRPAVESLEDRRLMAGNVLQTNLVSDLPGVAQVTDPNLVNPWGISASAGSPFWISDNNAGVSTLYNSNAKSTPPFAVSINPLVVSIPTPGDPAGSAGAPTGTVFNIDLKDKAFPVTDGTHTAPAVFLFATEDGTIAGWNPGVDPTGKFVGPGGASTHAVLPVDNSTNPSAADGAVYKGLTIATDANGRTLLYAANFRSGQVDVFDTSFKAAKLPTGAFTDPNLPKGYAPFDVQELGGKIYVTYAKQNAVRHDDVGGEGHGFVDVFNLDGSAGLDGGKVRLVSRGALDSPWGLALAPASFGDLAGSLLVGNFKNGHINAYDARTGASHGALKDPDGEPIEIDGLWALKVGNGGNGGDAKQLYFTAGLDHEKHGLFGSLTSVAPGTPEGPAEAQKVQAALDVFQLDLTAVLKDISSGAPAATLRQDIQTLNVDFVNLVRTEILFAIDQFNDTHPGHRGDRDILDDLFAGFGDRD